MRFASRQSSWDNEFLGTRREEEILLVLLTAAVMCFPRGRVVAGNKSVWHHTESWRFALYFTFKKHLQGRKSLKKNLYPFSVLSNTSFQPNRAHHVFCILKISWLPITYKNVTKNIHTVSRQNSERKIGLHYPILLVARKKNQVFPILTTSVAYCWNGFRKLHIF